MTAKSEDLSEQRQRAAIDALNAAVEALKETRPKISPFATAASLGGLLGSVIAISGLIWSMASWHAADTENRKTTAQTATILSDTIRRQNDFERWMMEQYGDYRQWRRQVNGRLSIEGDANEPPRR